MQPESTVVTDTDFRKRVFAQTQLKPAVRLTRAHLSLQARPAVLDEARAALNAVCEALSKQLSSPVTAEARLRDATLSPLSHLSEHALFVLIELANRAVALVEIDSALANVLLQQAAGAVEAVTLPTQLTRIEQAAMGWLFLASISALNQSPFATRYAPKLISLHTGRSEAMGYVDALERHVAIDIALEMAGHAGSIRVIAPALALQSFVERDAPGPAAAAAPSVLAATVEAMCVAGLTTLSAHDYRTLVEGDVLLFRDLKRTATGAVRGAARVCTKTFVLTGELGPDGFTLTTSNPTQKPMLKTPEPTAPIEIEVELTRLRIALHDLGMLKAGTVVPLHINGAQPVTLRIGDKAVARAELVDIEGEVGARILTLF